MLIKMALVCHTYISRATAAGMTDEDMQRKRSNPLSVHFICSLLWVVRRLDLMSKELKNYHRKL